MSDVLETNDETKDETADAGAFLGAALAETAPAMEAAEEAAQEIAPGFTVQVRPLREALAAVAMAIPKKHKVLVLSNVLIRMVGTDMMQLMGTDMEVAVQATIPALIPPFTPALCVDAHHLLGLLKVLSPQAYVTLTVDSEEFSSLASETATYRLPALPVTDFPPMAPMPMTMPKQRKPKDGFCGFGMPAAELVANIGLALKSVSTELTRYYLNGILMHRREKEAHLRMASTDGHRLAALEVKSVTLQDPLTAIVPLITLKILHKLLAKPPVDVEMLFNSTRVSATIPGLVITSKIIEGTFPEYERVLPQAAAERAFHISIEPFKAAVDLARASLVPPVDKSAPVVIRGESGKLLVGDHMVVGGYSPFDFYAGFQSRYVLDMIASCPTDTVLMTLPSDFKPDKPAGGPVRFDAPNWRYVLMPMRV